MDLCKVNTSFIGKNRRMAQTLSDVKHIICALPLVNANIVSVSGTYITLNGLVSTWDNVSGWSILFLWSGFSIQSYLQVFASFLNILQDGSVVLYESNK